MPISYIPVDNLLKRIIAFGIGVTLLAGSAFAVLWGFANAAASQAEFIEVAEQAVSVSPGDPQTHYAMAVLLDDSFDPGDFDKALGHYETAASLSQYNYWYWLELGRAYERRGDPAKAETALRYALSLAPNYATAQWSLGNALLRQGKTEEAFALIRTAVAGDPKYTETAATLAWQLSGGDINAVRSSIGDSVRLNAALAALLAKEKRFDESAAVWSAIPAAERRDSLKEAGAALFSQMLEAKRFRAAVQIASEISEGENERTAIGRINNGGFENAVKPTGAQIFDWQLGAGQNPQIVLTNGQKRSGSNSLVLVYNAGDRSGNVRGFSQTVAVEPGKTYTLRFAYRSELKTAANFKFVISNAADSSPIAASDPISASSDWAAAEVRFTVPMNTDGVVIEFKKDSCPQTVCTVSGSLWIDDVSLSE